MGRKKIVTDIAAAIPSTTVSSVETAQETTAMTETTNTAASTVSTNNNQETNAMTQTNTVTAAAQFNALIGQQFIPSTRETSLTAQDVFALKLGELEVGVLNDLKQDEAGEWRLAFYNNETKLMEGPQVLFTSDRKRYERVFSPSFNVFFEDKAHFINLRQLGRALAVVQGYHIMRANDDVLAAFPLLQGATAAFVFISKQDSTVIRFVRFDGLKATTYRLEYDFNRDPNGATYITNRYLKLHEIDKNLRDQVVAWNVKAGEKGLNALDVDTVKNKFVYAVYLAMGFRIVIPVFRNKVERINTETGEKFMGLESNAQVIARLTEAAEGRTSKVAHLEDGFQRETAQIAGLRRIDFALPAETE